MWMRKYWVTFYFHLKSSENDPHKKFLDWTLINTASVAQFAIIPLQCKTPDAQFAVIPDSVTPQVHNLIIIPWQCYTSVHALLLFHGSVTPRCTICYYSMAVLHLRRTICYYSMQCYTSVAQFAIIPWQCYSSGAQIAIIPCSVTPRIKHFSIIPWQYYCYTSGAHFDFAIIPWQCYTSAQVSNEACIGGYQISHIPWSKQANIPYKSANIPIINFLKFSISLEVTKILNQVSHIPGSKMDSILYPWK